MRCPTPWKGKLVASTNIRTRRLIAVGAFAVAAAAPVLVATMTTSAAPQNQVAAPACLAWYGNLEDGKCLSYSNGQPIIGGMPPVAIGSPNSGNPGLSTGPLLPGQTWNVPLG
jgi:hypothetical protein